MTRITSLDCSVQNLLQVAPGSKSDIANILRAVADQVVPKEPDQEIFQYCCDYSQFREREIIRRKILEIANGLDSST